MESALHEAVRRNDAARVTRLLSEGAAPDEADWLGLTPLHCAATSGADELARLLLEAGADCNLRDEDGVSPVHLCVRRRANAARRGQPPLTRQRRAGLRAAGTPPCSGRC